MIWELVSSRNVLGFGQVFTFFNILSAFLLKLFKSGYYCYYYYFEILVWWVFFSDSSLPIYSIDVKLM